MIDPQNIVRDDYTDQELQELILFCICVAGKSAKVIAPRVHTLFRFLQLYTGNILPLLLLDWTDLEMIRLELQMLGIGCYRGKSISIVALSTSKLDLRTCTSQDLEYIYGIGPKTARAFICWSRPGVKHAILDTHILKWLKQQGVENVPKSTPSGRRYNQLEKEFLQRVPNDMSPAEFDLSIWKQFAV